VTRLSILLLSGAGAVNSFNKMRVCDDRRVKMATIVIKDLAASKELDRKAMRAIIGGGAGWRLGTPAYQSEFFQPPVFQTGFKFAPFDLDTTSR